MRLETFQRRLEDGTAWTTGWTKQEVDSMATVITHIATADENEAIDVPGISAPRFPYRPQNVLLEGSTLEEMNPKAIVDVLIQLDPDDLDDVMRGLRQHYDSVVGTE